MNHSGTYIAGTRTPEDWETLRQRLLAGNDRNAWQEAFENFFLARLNLRYFDPIKLLQDHGTLQGEGFSIVAIQCSLVEFLETTIQGISYRYLRRGESLGRYEYSKSGEVFISFLTNREPFRQDFDIAAATAFYECVRCGLLHEARTKDGWKIWARSPNAKPIDANTKTVFRDDLQTAFEKFLQAYQTDLFNSAELQAAFIRKFDSLCVG
jgi:hypothetical protein